MGWIGPVLSGVSALAGLFGLGKTNKTIDQTTTSSQTPVYDPTNQAFRDQLIGAYRNNLNTAPQFAAAYKTGGLQNIADTSGAASKAVGDILTSRGIGRTTAGASALTDSTYQAGKQISQFLTQMPITLDQRQQALLNAAGGYQASLPVGQTGTQHTTGYNNTQVSPSSPLAGAVQGGAQGLAGYLGAMNAQNTLGKILKQIGGSSGTSGAVTSGGGSGGGYDSGLGTWGGDGADSGNPYDGG